MVEGRARVVIESVAPSVDGGRFPAKRVIGDAVQVEAVVFTDGHDQLRCEVHVRHESDTEWSVVALTASFNDRWHASFPVPRLGRYVFRVRAWVDPFGTWLHGITRKIGAGQDVAMDLRAGAVLLDGRAAHADGTDTERIRLAAGALRSLPSGGVGLEDTLDDDVLGLIAEYDPADFATASPDLEIVVEPERARHGAWYEFFPRSTGDGTHGTFKTAAGMLEYVAELGFDVVYLPPIHPIGTTNRKGPNNALSAGAGDPGSPWAIGGEAGGHRAIHPELGTMADFRAFVARARTLGLDVAIDIAFQCSPDHPLVTDHPEWFRRRPDGSIACAENPPKRYEDVVPFDFECDDWRGLWEELCGTFLFWASEGVTIFRVDNPHTKPFGLWEWLIPEVKRRHPEAIFLSEAFTRPALLHGLARRGFSQSYNYFPWRNTRHEIESYLTELTSPPGREYLRPSLWTNTPDILTEYLQGGGRPAFMARFLLASTLGANYGVYGPAFELCEAVPREPGSEEYLDSEKYQVRHWDLDAPWSLRHLMQRVNTIRRAHPALRQDWNLAFFGSENHQILCYAKYTDDRSDIVVTAINIDPHVRHAGHVELDLGLFGFDGAESYVAEDLLGGGRYIWEGSRNYVELDPGTAHIFVMRQHPRTERDFEYFE